MPRWTKFAAVAAVSILTHLPGVASPPLDYHYHRQANTASIARAYHRLGLPPWEPRVDWEGRSSRRAATELPLYMWLVGLLWPLLGLGDLWGRLASIAFSAAGAAFLLAFLERKPDGRGWLEPPAALAASLAFSVLPVQVYFGRTIQPEALALFASILSLWSLDRYLAQPKAVWWALAWLGASLAIGHKIPYAYLLGVLGSLALARRGAAALRDLSLWALAAVTLAAVFAWYRYASSGVYVVPTSGESFWKLLEYERLPYFFVHQTFSRLPELALTYAGILFFAAGARALVRERSWFLLAWWACVYVYILAGGGYVHHHEYTALPWAPVNAAVIGAGFWSLWSGARRRWAKPALIAAALAMPLHAGLRIRHWYRLSMPQILELGPVVDRLSAPDDLFVCNERASSLILYFIDRKGWSWGASEEPESRRRLEEKIALGARFYLTPKSGVFADRKHPFAAWLFKRHRVVFEDEHALIFRLSVS